MSEDLKELQKLFPSSKQIIIAGKTLNVKPMVWTDFLNIIEDFGKIMSELGKDKDFDLSEFDEKKDLAKLTPVIKEILSIFAKWLKVKLDWLKDNLTLKQTMELLNVFFEVNEWDDVKSLFLALRLKVQNQAKK